MCWTLQPDFLCLEASHSVLHDTAVLWQRVPGQYLAMVPVWGAVGWALGSVPGWPVIRSPKLPLPFDSCAVWAGLWSTLTTIIIRVARLPYGWLGALWAMGTGVICSVRETRLADLSGRTMQRF